jgi:hypothetical protein
MSDKLPAFQFYPADWKKDPGIQALEFFERHVWFEMLLLMHESKERGVLLLNGAPMPHEACARALGLDNQIFERCLSKLLTYGVAERRKSDGAIVNRRMVRDEELRKIRQKSGFLGGNPQLKNRSKTKTLQVLDKQILTTPLKQIPTPSSSSSSSSSSSVPSSKEEATIQEPPPKTQPERFPSPIVEGCVYFRMCEKEKELVKAWYRKNQFPVELIPEAVAMVENWMVTGSKSGARAARKLPTHFKHCYATWVLDKLGDVASARRRLNGTSLFQNQTTQQRSPHTRTFKGPLPAFPGSPKGEAK